MKNILFFALFALVGIGVADAAVRENSGATRQKNEQAATTTTTATTARTATQRVSEKSTTARTNATTTARDVSNRSATTVSRSASVGRAATTTVNSRNNTTAASTSRAATIARSATKNTTTARAAVASTTSQTFGTGYNACRDAYFTCMDQFCAKADDTYRRCVCSSRLEEIKTKERALGQTGQQLQDFKDLNIDSISKTSGEVKAMLTATTGESASTKDTSDSAQKLAGISAVLNKTKSQSLSTQGKLDIAGDINMIWSTTDLAAGADLMNLTGEKLYNAVHSQCANFVKDNCETTSVLNMVVSAYGMYIENDCTNLSNSIGKKITEASGAIRETEREMQLARLENYDAHNSTSINNCIAQVRKDITSESACGSDYVHCLDITGKYLNRDTGEPIYTSNFYQLELQTSLTGDVLSNKTNRMLIIELNRKKEFAERGLDTCRDLASDVWDEFMRQAIAEIYQGQQARIRQVKNECIDVVNNCYDVQNKSLKDFSNIKEQLLLGARLELSEQMCKEKLDACSNLYGGGDTGLTELVATMSNITDQKIAKDCKTTLQEYAMDICIVPSSDTVHSYPFACRIYAPGSQQYASIPKCNEVFTNSSPGMSINPSDDGTSYTNGYNCPTARRYKNCKSGYYLADDSGIPNSTPNPGNRCAVCWTGYTCAGGTAAPILSSTEEAECGADYIGSLYQKMVRYAMQTCVRPSEMNNIIPTTVLADVNVVMDSIKSTMGKELSKECERLGGIWVDTPCIPDSDPTCNTQTQTGGKLFEKFYSETSSNTRWGYCMPNTTE